ncbi:MAG: PQQ-dependent sugar dehydrogenase, partial [Verrucomicrobia bacterium]|nr:PQQ-dependent sugar dehydrogenase [Cytophagales bacterium]
MYRKIAVFSLALLIPCLIFWACQQKQVQVDYSKLSEEDKRKAENALAGIKIADDLQAQLFASEPMMLNPTNLDIDARGRIWVCEGFNYRNEYNLTNPEKPQGDRILILEDTDGDGKADKSKVFYQGTDVNAALGIAVLGNKVIVSCSPNVFLFTDENGDDVADKKEILFGGLAGEQTDHAIHAFSFGPDGKLYFNYGNNITEMKDKNGNILKDDLGRPITGAGKPYRQGMVLRCDTDGSNVEVLGHNFRNMYEVAVDSYGTMWQSDNDDDGNKATRINYVMQYGSYGYTDEMTGAGWSQRRTNSETEIPKRHWHQNDPGSIPNMLYTGAGSPTGMAVYEGDLLPKRFQNQLIHTDAGPNAARTYPIASDGAGYKATIENMLDGSAGDQWFRPADIGVAPDGSVFVADWYDPGVGGHWMKDTNRGRIIRLLPKGSSRYKVPKFDFNTAEGCAEALKNPNVSVRYTAWTKLHILDKKAEPALLGLWNDANPRFRARALWLLGKMKNSGEEYIQRAINDKDPNIRITAIRLATQVSKNPIAYLSQLINDKDPQVLREVALALHHNTDKQAPELWAKLAEKYDGKDRWYLEALGIGADNQWDTFFDKWLLLAG